MQYCTIFDAYKSSFDAYNYLIWISIVLAALTVSAIYYTNLQNGSKNESVKFTPTKKLSIKDSVAISLLDEEVKGEGKPCYCITDPDLHDNPIVYSSEGFCLLTQYVKEEVEGKFK